MTINKLSDVYPIRAFFMNKNNIINYVYDNKQDDINKKESYEVTLVLGCKNYNIMKNRMDEAIKLYKNHNIKKIILCGGIGFFGKNRKEPEAKVMRSYLLDNNILNSDIIVEDKSRNTFQNMKNSIKYIESTYGYDKKIVIITSDFHIKRAKGMLENLTDLSIYTHSVKENIPVNKLIRLEAFLLSYYTHRGIIKDKNL